MELKELSEKFNEALQKESKESLTKWLKEQELKIQKETFKQKPCVKCVSCVINYAAKYNYEKYICKKSGNYVTDIHAFSCNSFDEL